jgi:hypothetical protein
MMFNDAQTSSFARDRAVVGRSAVSHTPYSYRYL